MWYIYIPWNITQPLKKNEIIPLAAIWIDLEIVIGEGNGTPLQYFCLENPMDGGAW